MLPDTLQILLLCLRACVPAPLTGVIRPSCRLCSFPLHLASLPSYRLRQLPPPLLPLLQNIISSSTEALLDHRSPVATFSCKGASRPAKSFLSMVLLKSNEEQTCQIKDPQDNGDQVCGLRPQEDTGKIRSRNFTLNAKQAAEGQAQEFQALAPRGTLEASISCTTFNILAPIYKRVGGESCRESHFHDAWLSRNQRILDMLLLVGSSIICLQEFWLKNEELVHMYEHSLGHSGYTTHKLARTNNRGDGLLTAIKTDRIKVLNYKELFFYDCGDRVAQIFHLRLEGPSHKQDHLNEDLLLVNTHLLFPHDFTFCPIRLRQVHKIIESLAQYERENCLHSVPVILCGDWNGSKRGHVYKFLRSQGFVSSYDAVHSYTDSDAHKWISHRNHRGDLCGVDFIWLRNPSVSKRLPSASWKEALLGIIKGKAPSSGLHYCSMNGFGFGINDAFLFPPEVEEGLWPEEYSLSDHAPLTAVFEPIKACNN